MNIEIENIYNSQKEFFASGRTKPIEFRVENLTRLKKVLKKYKKEIFNALNSDLKKSSFESYITEIYQIKKEIEHAIDNICDWASTQKVKTPSSLFGSKSSITPEPLGLVLVISPWNYPFALSLIPVIGAIAAGNCVILKPSEISANSSKVLKKIIEEAFQENYVCVIEGDHEVAQNLLSLKFDYIFFTGSSNVGKIVMRAAAENLTPLTLELGGKSPCVVEPDADIKKAAKKIAWGKFLNAGQTCIAPDYVLVHEDIEEKLISEIEKYIKKFFGRNSELSPDYGKIINEQHFDRLNNFIQNTEIVFGGNSNKSNLYIAPTIIKTNLDGEIFGPILPIISYKNIDQAINYIKNNPKPLAIYIFTENIEAQDKIINNTSSGAICINDTLTHAGSVYLPFGGVGQSGFGRYHGKTSFETFSNYKSVVRSGRFELPFRYPPYRFGSRIISYFMDKIF